MFSNPFIPNYKSRFRILKGGRISLVVSALLISTITTSAHAICNYETEICTTPMNIDLSSGDQLINISNSGGIQTTNTDYAISAYNGYSYSGNEFSLTNAGTISSTNDYGSTTGISIDEIDAYEPFSITNSGTISAVSTSYDSYGISANALYENSIISNSGTIEATSGGFGTARSIRINYMYGNASILNSSTIEAQATGYGSAYGIDGYVMYDNSSIQNSGTISVTSNNNDAIGINILYMIGNDDYTPTITNSGTIEVVSNYGNNKGIAIGYMQNAAILNDTGGEIIVTGNLGYNQISGISLGNEIDYSSITNAGTITVNANGYYSQASGIYARDTLSKSTIENTNSIIVSAEEDGSYGYGIVTNNLSGSSVTNSGSITVSADIEGWGIKIAEMEEYNSSSSFVLNNGTVSVTTNNGDAFGIGSSTDVFSMHNSSYIENETDGVIDVSGTNAYGIHMTDMYESSYITNKGEIIAQATNEAWGIKAIHMEGDSFIKNSGIITLNSEYSAVGIGSNESVPTSLHENAYIENSTTGVIEATGAIVASGIVMDGMFDYSTISNHGTISVDSQNASMGVYATNMMNYSSILNTGTITATIDGVADATGYSIYTSGSEGTSVLNETSGELYGNINVSNSTFTNKGLISLPNNANNANSAFITNFNQDTTGILEIALMSDESGVAGMSYSQLRTNTATFADASTLKINVESLDENQRLLVGSTMQDVVSAETEGGLSVETLTIADNSRLLDFEYLIDGDTIDLEIIKGLTIEESILLAGDSAFSDVASTLDTIMDGDYPEMDEFFSALGSLETDEDIAQAVASVTPITTTSSFGATSQIINGIQGIVDQRQGSGNGLNSGDTLFAEKNFWFKPYGTWGKQDNKDGMYGFDLHAKGLGLGIDAEYGTNQRVGFAFFYTDADVDVNSVTQSSDLDIYTAMIYGKFPIIDNKTNLLYQVGYSWQDTKSNRYISILNDTAIGEYTSKTASADLKLLRDYKLDSTLLLQPVIQATYRNFYSPSYSEKNAGALGLNIDSFSSDEFILGIGTIAKYKVGETSNLVANINIGYNLIDDDETVTSSFQGAQGVKFDTDGIDNGRWNYEAGIGCETNINSTNSLNFMYNYQAQGSDFNNHVLSAKYILKF